MIEDDANSVLIGIAFGIAIIIGCFLDWSSGAEDSFYTLDSSGAPSFFSASSEKNNSAKKQNIEPTKKQSVEPAKKLIIEPTLKPDTSDYSKSTKSPQTVDASRQDN